MPDDVANMAVSSMPASIFNNMNSCMKHTLLSSYQWDNIQNINDIPYRRMQKIDQMPSQDNNNGNPSSSGNSRGRRYRRPRRNRNNNNDDDPDAAFKDQIKAERRAQVMQNAADQEDNQQERSGEAIGDNMQAANVSSVPRSSSRNGSGGSSSRSGRSRRHRTRPANKGPSKAAPSQVGAVATTGRAFGAPRRPPSAPNNMTRSIAGDGHYESSDEENAAATSRNTKEAVAMNTMTVEDHEREKRRRRKVQEEASRLTQEIKDESSKNKKKPYEKEMAFAVAEEDDDAEKAEEPAKGRNEPDHSDEARRWKRIAICLGCVLLVAAIGVGVFVDLQEPASEAGAVASGWIYQPPSQQDCSAIRSGMSFSGQKALEQSNAWVELEVELPFNGNVDLLLSELKLKIQGTLLPEIAGCGQEEVDSNNDPYRYLIANALVDTVSAGTNVYRACSNANQLCNIVSIQIALQIFRKGPLGKITVLEYITSSFSIGDDLAPKLNLVSPVGRIVTLNVSDQAAPHSAVAPTESPTVALIYEPPSPEDCARLLNGLPLDDQDQFLVRRFFLVDMDVELTIDMPPDQISLPDLKAQIEKNLIPPLVGCSLDADVGRLNDGLAANRYVIANALVTVRSEDETCSPDRSLSYCYRIAVELELLLKGDTVRISTLVSRISEVLSVLLEADPLLLSMLGLEEPPFQRVVVVGMRNIDPTQSPSINPSFAPGAADPTTEYPTRAPTLRPTTLVIPTRVSSINPTLVTSINPTFTPINTPTSDSTPTPTRSP